MIAPKGQILELVLDELTAMRANVVDEHVGVKMVELMLHDTG